MTLAPNSAQGSEKGGLSKAKALENAKKAAWERRLLPEHSCRAGRT